MNRVHCNWRNPYYINKLIVTQRFICGRKSHSNWSDLFCKFDMPCVNRTVFIFDGNQVNPAVEVRHVERRSLIGENHHFRKIGSIAGDRNECPVAILRRVKRNGVAIRRKHRINRRHDAARTLNRHFLFQINGRGFRSFPICIRFKANSGSDAAQHK